MGLNMLHGLRCRLCCHYPIATTTTQAVFAPSLTCNKDVQRFDRELIQTSRGIFSGYNATLQRWGVAYTSMQMQMCVCT